MLLLIFRARDRKKLCRRRLWTVVYPGIFCGVVGDDRKYKIDCNDIAVFPGLVVYTRLRVAWCDPPVRQAGVSFAVTVESAKVGIYKHGLGGEGILESIKNVKGIEAEMIEDLEEKTLFQYDMVILSCPGISKEKLPLWRLYLMNYVDSGFGVNTQYAGAA